MPRFLIELTHGDEYAACVKSLQALERHGSHLVTHADWDCKAGVHRGWLIVELNRYSREEVVSWVAGHGG